MVAQTIGPEMEAQSGALLKTALPIEAEEENSPKCAHYWIIEPANGPVSIGVCQVCQGVKGFKNFVDGRDSEF